MGIVRGDSQVLLGWLQVVLLMQVVVLLLRYPLSLLLLQVRCVIQHQAADRKEVTGVLPCGCTPQQSWHRALTVC